jgi:hypothetical protein
MISDVSQFDDTSADGQHEFLERFLGLSRSTVPTPNRPFRTFTGLAGTICRVSVSSFLAVYADYAQVSLEVLSLDDGPDATSALIHAFIVRPAARDMIVASVAKDHWCFGRVEAAIAGPPSAFEGQGRQDRLVFSLAEAPWHRAFPELPAADLLLLRMFHECTDVPLEPAGGFPAERNMPPMVRDWYLRAPADHSARARGMLFVWHIVSWELDSGLVRAFVTSEDVGDRDDDDDDDEPSQAAQADVRLDALFVPPLMLGETGPWLRLDTFAGAASLELGRSATVTREAVPHVPIFTLDARAGRPP